MACKKNSYNLFEMMPESGTLYGTHTVNGPFGFETEIVMFVVTSSTKYERIFQPSGT